MGIHARAEGATTVLDLTGPVVLGTAGEPWGTGVLRRRIAAAAHEDHPDVIVNLARVSRIDTSGLTELVTAHHAVATRGGHLRLVEPPERIRSLLRVTGLNAVLEVYDSEADAVARGREVRSGANGKPALRAD